MRTPAPPNALKTCTYTHTTCCPVCLSHIVVKLFTIVHYSFLICPRCVCYFLSFTCCSLFDHVLCPFVHFVVHLFTCCSLFPTCCSLVCLLLFACPRASKLNFRAYAGPRNILGPQFDQPDVAPTQARTSTPFRPFGSEVRCGADSEVRT